MQFLELAEGTIQFPEEYQIKGYKLNSEDLSPLAEEMLWAWSTLAEKYAMDKVYQENFYSCLEVELSPSQRKLEFPADFSNILSVMNREKVALSEKRKQYNKEHRKEISEEKQKRKDKYGYALVDGEKVELANTMIESPRIFIGRGSCSLSGNWVYRVKPEDVSINSSVSYPCPIKNHNWREVKFKDTMSIATYTENVGNRMNINKAIWFSPKSEFKADSDMEKFEKARLLQINLKKVNKAIENACKSSDKKTMQIGSCAYLISVFGIRAGNPNEKENGVVGASTLLVNNIELGDKHNVTLDFIGKDSIHFIGTKRVSDYAYTSLCNCMAEKHGLDRLFDLITSNDVNKFLQGILPDILPLLSGKTFRTEFGCSLLASEIQGHDWENLTDKEFKVLYDKCVLTVAKKLNHQKTVSKEQGKKIDNSVKERLNKAGEVLKNRRESIKIKLQKLLDTRIKYKLQYSGKILKEKLDELDEKKRELEGKLVLAESRYKNLKEELTLKKNNKSINLGTSKANYSNPKIAYSLCKCYNKDPKLIYSKSLIERFDTWAKDVDTDYWKKYPFVE